MGGDFNVRITMLLDTIDTGDLCELLHAPELIETKQPSAMVKRQNCDTTIGGWGRELLDLCCDAGLLIFNGWMLGDESGEFTCLENGGRNSVNYIIGSPVVW